MLIAVSSPPKYANLYHRVVGDTKWWKGTMGIDLPCSGRPYYADDGEPPELSQTAKKTPPRPSTDQERLTLGPKLDPTRGMSLHSEAANSLSYLQARQESNLQPPVLETGALPIELRTSDY